jgi:hypothetical protein
MMRKFAAITAIMLLSVAVFAADITDYGKIAISSPLITQIYTNPEISKNEDLELQPEAQIMLYEKLGDEICKSLKDDYKDKIEFTCFNEIQNKLSNANWNEFNRLFTGKDAVEKDIAASFGEKLEVDGVFDTYLMFSYYDNSNGKRHLETHYEWYLIDLASGETAVSGKYDCADEFKEEKDMLQREMKCFNGIIESPAERGR